MSNRNEDITGTPPVRTFTAGAYRVDVYPACTPGSPIVYLNGFSDTGAAVREQCRLVDCPDFTLAAISGLDWNRDLSPWPCGPTVSDSEPFAGGASAYLETLCTAIIPATERMLRAPASRRALAGYSLAGLFSLWASLQTDAFAQVASISGSLWFPDFIDYVRAHSSALKLDALYLSLGKKETRTPNRMMRHVLECTRQVQQLADECGVVCTFELNPGNHFSRPAWRCAKGITWLLTHESAPGAPVDQI